MNSKKILTAALAGAMAISMTSIAAFAEDPAPADKDITAAGEQTYAFTAGFNAPVIDVTLPTTLAAVINPYKIAIDLSAAQDGSLMTGTDGIASPEYTITNNSDTFGIKVAAKLSAKGTGIMVVSDPAKIPTKVGSDKVAFTFLNTTTTGASGEGTYANDEYKADDTTQLKFTDTVPERFTTMMSLDVKDSGTEIGYFKVQGSVTDPDVVGRKYATTDKLALNIVFDINPFNPNAAGGGAVTPPAAVTPDVEIDATSSTLNGITLTGTTFKVTADLSDGNSDTADMTLNDADGDVIKKTGTNVTVAIKTDDDSILTIANNGKITVGTTGTPGTYTATITLTDTVNSKTQDYTITMKEVA